MQFMCGYLSLACLLFSTEYVASAIIPAIHPSWSPSSPINSAHSTCLWTRKECICLSFKYSELHTGHSLKMQNRSIIFSPCVQHTLLSENISLSRPSYSASSALLHISYICEVICMHAVFFSCHRLWPVPFLSSETSTWNTKYTYSTSLQKKQCARSRTNR